MSSATASTANAEASKDHAQNTTGIEAGQEAEITLHWLEQSRSHRILWALEECRAPYKLQTYKRGADRLADSALKKIHPLGKSPIITVKAPGKSEAEVIPESGFITEYLLDYFGHEFVPKRWKDGREGVIGGETEEWVTYRHFMHYTEGSFMIILVMALVFSMAEQNAPTFAKPLVRFIVGQVRAQFLQKNLDLHFDYVEEHLKTVKGDYLCGEQLTGADFMMEFPLQMVGTPRTGHRADQFPQIQAYLGRLHSREAYKRACNKIEDATGGFKMSK